MFRRTPLSWTAVAIVFCCPPGNATGQGPVRQAVGRVAGGKETIARSALSDPTLDQTDASRVGDQAWVWLRGGGLLHGQIQRTASEVIVATTAAKSFGEIRLAHADVKAIIADPVDLYTRLTQTRRPRDPRDYEEWFHYFRRNQFPQGADWLIAEADLRFGKSLVWQTRRDRLTRRGTEQPDAAETKRSSTPNTDLVRTVSFERPAGPTAANVQDSNGTKPTDPLDRSPRFVQYARHLQPVLINRCGRCHSGGDLSATPDGFRLMSGPNGRTTPRQTRDNFRALNRRAVRELREPASGSPLPETMSRRNFLTMATRPHGGLTQPPLGVRHAEAIERLKRWMSQPTGGVRSSSHLTAASEISWVRSEVPPRLKPVHRGPAAVQSHHGIDHSTTNGRIRRLPVPVNPTDPAAFNRRRWETR